MPQDTPLSAGLAKRLAEAADGFRDNLYHFFLAVTEHPYHLVCTEGSSSKTDAYEQAKAKLKELEKELPGRQYEIYGPYLTSAEKEIEIDYDSIEVRMMHSAAGLVRSATFVNVDAIVFNRSAFDKFFLPYYTRLYGPDKVAEISSNADTTLSATKMAPHQRCTICKGVIE